MPEAFEIAKKRKMFVSETFLVASDKDGRAVVIEKTPEQTEMYEVDGDQITSTNHFQSEILGNTTLNKEHMKTSASAYRQQRLEELLNNIPEGLSAKDAATVLRNRDGLGGKSIGLGNEKAVNQLIAHHSVIFQPHERRMWVSTAPWQLGKYVCYDLDSVLNNPLTSNHEILNAEFTIPADTSFTKEEINEFMKYAKYRFAFSERESLVADSVVTWNPDSYHSYMLAGDASMKEKNYSAALGYYKTALTKELATTHERDYVNKQITKCNEALK